nr:MAG TPA: hypothetical protein [Caudoviricetes sp.]
MLRHYSVKNNYLQRYTVLKVLYNGARGRDRIIV